ncbi:MAG: hypothetical protein JKX85_09820, partial [Phycisphaeraceae bacterium]|nr:hypothetical protein [Phycisphaeraceae bacterium]
ATLFAGAGYQSNWAATVDWDANDAVSEEIVALNSQTGNLFVNIDFTTYDTNNFFDTQLKKDLLQYAATSVANRFGDTLTAITPDANNTWDQVFFAPNTGLTTNVANATILQNEIVFYAGGRDLAGSTLGVGGPGGYGAAGFQPFFDTLEARGQAGALGANADKTDFSLWGGSIAFDTNSSWYYGIDNDEQAGESDFLSVALHEMVHGFGFGTSETWDNLSVNSLFTGTQTTNLYGSSPPVQPSHFDFGVTDPSTGQEAAMDPNITTGTRKVITPLDFAVLDDMGWDLLSEPALLDDGSVTNSHIYTLPGMYTVTLKMLDTQSNLVTYTVLLQVIDVLQVATLTPNGAGSNADAPGYTAPNFSAFKQRSILQSVVITFNRAATGLTAADVQLKHIDQNGVTSTPTLTDNMISTSDNITYTLNLQSLTLTDGVYELLISNSVIDALTQANMDGDQDDISGGLFTSTRFHQLGGDFNGDAQFDLSDLPALAHYWKGHTVNPPAYLDLNSDNTVNHLDLTNFTTWMSRLNLQVVEQIQAPPQQSGNLALAIAAYQNGQASLTLVPASQVANGDAVAYEDLIGQWIA